MAGRRSRIRIATSCTAAAALALSCAAAANGQPPDRGPQVTFAESPEGLEIRIAAPVDASQRVVRLPRQARLCLPPGSSTPRRC